MLICWCWWLWWDNYFYGTICEISKYLELSESYESYENYARPSVCPSILPSYRVAVCDRNFLRNWFLLSSDLINFCFCVFRTKWAKNEPLNGFFFLSRNKVNRIFYDFFCIKGKIHEILRQSKQVLSKSLVYQFVAASAKLGP